MDRILIILKKENGPRASSAPALGLNTIIFKHVYWYMQQTQVSVYRTIGPLVSQFHRYQKFPKKVRKSPGVHKPFVLGLNFLQTLSFHNLAHVKYVTVIQAVSIIEPPRGKTNNVVSEQDRHKPTCTSTEKS